MQSVDASGPDTGPVQNRNPGVGLYFLVVSVAAGIVMMNSAVGVYMAAYARLRHLSRSTRAVLPRPRRGALPLLYHPSAEQGSRLRREFHRAAAGGAVNAAVNAAVALSVLGLALEVRRAGGRGDT